MDAKGWIDIIDHIFWWLVIIFFAAYLLGLFDKD